jgi:hypothetical protein
MCYEKGICTFPRIFGAGIGGHDVIVMRGYAASPKFTGIQYEKFRAEPFRKSVLKKTIMSRRKTEYGIRNCRITTNREEDAFSAAD